LVQIFARREPEAPDEEKGGTEIVYELYGLSEAEIEVVEEAVAE
jgi:hypothetical protein